LRRPVEDGQRVNAFFVFAYFYASQPEIQHIRRLQNTRRTAAASRKRVRARQPGPHKHTEEDGHHPPGPQRRQSAARAAAKRCRFDQRRDGSFSLLF